MHTYAQVVKERDKEITDDEAEEEEEAKEEDKDKVRTYIECHGPLNGGATK